MLQKQEVPHIVYTVCDITFSVTAKVTFYNNEAVHKDRAIYLNDQTSVFIQFQ